MSHTCHACDEWVMGHTHDERVVDVSQMSHITRRNTACHTCDEWVTGLSCHTHDEWVMNKSKWVTSHIEIRHVTHMSHVWWISHGSLIPHSTHDEWGIDVSEMSHVTRRSMSHHTWNEGFLGHTRHTHEKSVMNESRMSHITREITSCHTHVKHVMNESWVIHVTRTMKGSWTCHRRVRNELHHT